MYAGRAVEKASQEEIFYRNHHPYTEGLLLSLPGYGDDRQRLRPIQGQPPSLITLPAGCSYHPRCPYVMDICLTQEPPLREVQSAEPHTSACWLPTDLAERQLERDRLAERTTGTFHRAGGAA
jgi:peptide/nickel transport system ATP-binding protein